MTHRERASSNGCDHVMRHYDYDPEVQVDRRRVQN
jgi:hypothetical protein